MADDGSIGFRMANLEGQMQTVNERLRAVDRMDERLIGVVDDVGEIKRSLKARDEAAETARAASRRDLFALTGIIVTAIIGAAATVLSQLPG